MFLGAPSQVAFLDYDRSQSPPERHWEAVAFEMGANVRARGTRDGKTPLHMAAEVQAVSAARDLLRHGADVNERDVLGMSPLHRAAFVFETS